MIVTPRPARRDRLLRAVWTTMAIAALVLPAACAVSAPPQTSRGQSFRDNSSTPAFLPSAASQPTSPTPGSKSVAIARDSALLAQLASSPQARSAFFLTNRLPGVVLCGANVLGRDQGEVYAWAACGDYTTGPNANIRTGSAMPIVLHTHGSGSSTVLTSIEVPRQAHLEEDLSRLFPPRLIPVLERGSLTVEPSAAELLNQARAMPTHTPSTQPTRPAAVADTCGPNQLHLEVAASDSTMSQPFVIVTVRDTAATACVVHGYVRLLDARGTRHGRRQSVPVDVHVSHSVFEHTSPRPHPVVITRARPAFFYVGASVAYQGARNEIELTKLDLLLPGLRTAFHLVLQLDASNPPGKPYPVGITALEGCNGASEQLGQPVSSDLAEGCA